MMECYYGSNVMCWYREQSPHPDLCHLEDHLNNHYGNKARLLLPSHPDLLHGASCLGGVLGEARGHCCDTWSVAAWALCLCCDDPRLGEGQRQCWCHIPAPHLTTRGPQFGHWGTLYIAS